MKNSERCKLPNISEKCSNSYKNYEKNFHQDKDTSLFQRIHKSQQKIDNFILILNIHKQSNFVIKKNCHSLTFS